MYMYMYRQDRPPRTSTEMGVRLNWAFHLAAFAESQIYVHTAVCNMCILYKEKGKLLRRRLSYVPAPFSRLNLITIDSLNLLLLRDGFTAVIISSPPPKKNSHFPAFLIAASQPRWPAWTSELPPYLFLRSPAILDPTVSHNN
jgi:hypothetical protein